MPQANQSIERRSAEFIHAPFFLVGVLVYLERSFSGDNILLMDIGSSRPLNSAKPVNGLDVIAVGPEGVEGVVRSDGDIGVVTKKRAAELITAVDGLSRYLIGHVR